MNELFSLFAEHISSETEPEEDNCSVRKTVLWFNGRIQLGCQMQSMCVGRFLLFLKIT